MSAETDAVATLGNWLTDQTTKLGWERIRAAGSPGFDLGLTIPHTAVLLATTSGWVLHLVTARGTRQYPLGPLSTTNAVLIDGLLFVLFNKATSELDHTDRSASAELATILRDISKAAHDTRYRGRAATLLAGHAIRDGYELQARMRLEEAITLFKSAGDITAAHTAELALNNLATLMSS